MSIGYDELKKILKKINDIKPNKGFGESENNKQKDRASTLELLYRGHQDDSNNLLPSVFRDLDRSEHDIYSYIMTKHSNEFIGMKPLEVLAKMQQSGVATRLLDVTKNVLVGLFFSVDSLEVEDTGNPSQVNNFSPSEKETKERKIDESKTKLGELIVFKCSNKDIKSYDSDTIKLLSCLPLLKEEKQKQLLFDAVNEYLIDVSTKSIFSQIPFSVKIETELQEIISFIKEVYYLDSKYGKDKNGLEYVLETMGILEKIKTGNDEWILKYNKGKKGIKYTIKKNDDTYHGASFNISKYDFEIDFKSLYSDEMGNKIEKNILILFTFKTVGNNGVIYNIKSIKGDNLTTKYITKENCFKDIDFYDYILEKESNNDSLFSHFKNGGYMSNSMEELHHRVKDYCPDFRYCARPLDIINGVFVYPLVNTDRMRAQQGLFAIYGLSQYWNFKKYFEYQKYNDIKIDDAIYQFLENDFNAHKKQLRGMENTIYGIDRIPIDSKKSTELKSALKKLGVDKEKLGCSMKTTYLNYTGNKKL